MLCGDHLYGKLDANPKPARQRRPRSRSGWAKAAPAGPHLAIVREATGKTRLMPDQFSPLAGKRVLVVDDSPQITALVGDVFALCGAVVSTANSAPDAMAQLQIAPFDLVVLDLVMPGQDGWDYPMQIDYADAWARTIDAIREIAAHRPGIKVAVEYKSKEPRTHILLATVCKTLLAI